MSSELVFISLRSSTAQIVFRCELGYMIASSFTVFEGYSSFQYDDLCVGRN